MAGEAREQWTAKCDEAESLSAEIAALETLDRLERAKLAAQDPIREDARRPASSAAVLDPGFARALAPTESFADHLRAHGRITEEHDGLTLGGFLRAIVTGPRSDLERRALSEGTDSAGGFTVPTRLFGELIDALREKSLLLRLGVRTVALDTDRSSFARLASDPTAVWHTEGGADVADSDPTFESVALVPRTLTALVKCSRELVQDSINLETALAAAFTGSLGTALDSAMLYGVAPAPTGLDSTVGVNSVEMDTDGAALSGYDKIIEAIEANLTDKAPMPSAAVMAPRTWGTIQRLKDGDGLPLRRPDALAALPFHVSSVIPIDQEQGASGAVCSSIWLGDWTQLLWGVRQGLQIQVLRELYTGTFELGYVAHLRADFAAAHEAAFCKLIGIKAS